MDAGKVLDTKRNRKSFLPNVEGALHIWFGEMISRPHVPPLSKQVLIEKAYIVSVFNQFDMFDICQHKCKHIYIIISLTCSTYNKEPVGFHAELFFVLVSMWLPQQHMVSIWTPHGIHVETLWCPV